LSIVNGRYASFDSENGSAFEHGKLSLNDLFDVAIKNTTDIKPRSGKQEYLENILNNHI
jgi:xylose isomerase